MFKCETDCAGFDIQVILAKLRDKLGHAFGDIPSSLLG